MEQADGALYTTSWDTTAIHCVRPLEAGSNLQFVQLPHLSLDFERHEKPVRELHNEVRPMHVRIPKGIHIGDREVQVVVPDVALHDL
ncbi:MAG: hypothetical protein CNCCGFBP_01320 [Fimbriimonadaceae bacterium]|nr:hypothetical protein [Fimbriimonadaceae bacterium]